MLAIFRTTTFSLCMAFGMRWPSALAGDLPTTLDYSKPLFTRSGTPICGSRDDLAAMLDLARKGDIEAAGQVDGCSLFPKDGTPVAVIDRQGILDVWMRVRLMVSPVEQPEYWVLAQTLRNDAPAIDGSGGTMRVCIASDGRAHLPELSVFRNTGQRVSTLTDSWTFLMLRPDTVSINAALVTTAPVDLTEASPCAEVPVRMLITSDTTSATSWNAASDNAWAFDHVLGYPPTRIGQPFDLDRARWRNAIRAEVTTNVTAVMKLSEEAAATAEPDNPLGRLAGDKDLAAKAALGVGGNFRICIWKDIDDIPDGAAQSVTVVPGVIFESGGPLVGDLRDPPSTLPGGPDPSVSSYGVVTTGSVTLSKHVPCAVTSVRSVISAGWPLTFPLVRASDHLFFSAAKWRGHPRSKGNLPDLVAAGGIHGTPTADVGHPLDIGDEGP